MSLQAILRAKKQAPEAPPAAPPPVADDDAAKVAAMIPNGGSVQTTPNGTRIVFDAQQNMVGTLPPKVAAEPPKPAAPPTAPPAPAQAPPPADDRCDFTDGDARCKDKRGHPGSMHDLDARPATQGIVPPDAPKSDPLAKPEAKGRKAAPKPATQENVGKGVAAAPAPTGDKPAAGLAPTPAPERGQGAEAPAERGAGAPVAVARVKGLALYVNCVPFHEKWEPLDDYAALKAAEVSAAMQVTDYRLAEVGAAQARGGIAGLVRDDPPKPGVYVAWCGSFDDPVTVVAEALWPMAEVRVRAK